MAAVLACGPEALLSYRSAGVLWEHGLRWGGPVEVTAPSNHRLRGVLVHRSRTVLPEDRTIHFGIPITSPVRTVIDLAEVLDGRQLAHAVNQGQIERRFRFEELAARLDRCPGRRAAKRLRPFVERWDGPTRSELEDDFLAFVERYDLPRPEINAEIAGHEIDVLWRAHGLVVEVDSSEFHDHRQPFEADRDKDADLVAAGLRVIRVTHRRMNDRPAREAARLRRALDLA